MAVLLLVEDEEIVLEITAEILETLGHRVLTARDGKEAEETVRQHGDEICVVLLDLSLPDGNGLDLMPIFFERNPGLKIIICSGDLTEVPVQYKNDPRVRLLAKPFSLENMDGTIHDLLASC